jgi:trk system potassium uptake protein TrkH
MQLRTIQRILGVFLMLFSLTMLPPVGVAWWYQDGALIPFLLGFGLIFLAGFLFWAPVYKFRRELRMRDGFVVVTMFWTVLGMTGALPFMLAAHPHMTFTNAVFESVSGLTTTGATVLTGLDTLPHAILYYRAQLHWLGGMGIIVLAVAILPMLGVGGMQLYRAETPGPMKDAKLTPRITETAKALWYIYLGLTIACAFAYWLAGMTPFDAIAHSFATLSTGGFSTHDLSMGYFHSPLIEMISVVFMVLAGANFSLHFMAWRSMSIKPYMVDSEVKAYLLILASVAAITAGYLYGAGAYTSIGSAVHNGIFQVVSFATSTGFTTSTYDKWPGFLPILLLFTSFVGGCAASTAGGIKTIRFLLLLKQGTREIKRLIHPNGQFLVKINGKALPDRVVESVWGFFSMYVAVFIIMMLILMFTGLDQVTAFSAVVACMNNLGPGLGKVSSNFASLNGIAKWTLSLAMIMGRLEIFTLLVLFTPTFWRR